MGLNDSVNVVLEIAEREMRLNIADTNERVDQGLRLLRSHDEIFFQRCSHKINTVFGGEPHFLEANRIIEFRNYLSSCVFQAPFVASMRRGCIRVVFGYNEISQDSVDRLRAALHPHEVGRVAEDLGLMSYKYRDIGARFHDALTTMERRLRTNNETIEL